jgi:ribosomal protein S18 acetylase RimI-like enzyme
MPVAQAQTVASGSIRLLTPADLERVVEIDREVSGESRRGFFVNRLAASRNESGAFISLAYIENGVVEGHALAHMLDGEFGIRERVVVLDTIGTSQSVRGHGGARLLVKELQLAAGASGAHALRTQALWSNESMMHFLAAAGFRLGTRIVLDRPCVKKPGEMPLGDVDADVSQDLARDRISVRSMTLADLPSMIGLDRDLTGRDRSIYLKRKVTEALRNNGVRLSMLAEIDETPAGFIMARVDYGEFGETEAEAVLDTIGVDPEFQRQGVGTSLLAQMLAQLGSLRVERVRTVVEWNDATLIAFLDRSGFKPTQNLTFTLLL